MMYLVIEYFFDIFLLGLIVFCVLSFIQTPQTQAARAWVGQFYEPMLAPLRKALENAGVAPAPIDFSPIVLWILVVIVRGLLLRILAA